MADLVRRGATRRYDIEGLIDWRPNIVFAAGQVAPVVSVKNTSGNMTLLDVGDGSKKLDTRRAQNGTYVEGDWKLKQDSYQTAEYGVEHPVDLTEALELGDLLDEEVLAGELSIGSLLQARETRVSEGVFNTTVFTGANYALAPSVKWDASAADYRADLKVAEKAMFKRWGVTTRGMTLVLAETLADTMVEILAENETIKYTNALMLNTREQQYSALKQYLKVGRLMIVNSSFDTTGLTSTADALFSRHWAEDKALLCFIAPSGSNSWKSAGVARQPVWSKFSNDYVIETYEEKRDNSIRVRAREYRGLYVNKDFGFLFYDVLT